MTDIISPVVISSNFTYDIQNIACHDYCVTKFVNEFNSGLVQATNSISNLIILNLLSVIIMFICTSKRMKIYLADHPENQKYVSSIQSLSFLGAFGFSWMMFIFGILHFGASVGLG